ncbi:MAG: LPS export ABC transporter permease LptF [Alphaproteobacteria bacterium]
MKGIQRYIMRHSVVGLLFVVASLTLAIWLSQSLQFIKFILNKGLSIGVFFELTLLLLPSFMLIILPIGLFLTVLFSFNKMSNDRELVVIRSSGVSNWAMASPVLIVALVVTGIGYFISLYLLPVSFQKFREMQLSIRNDFSALLLQEGQFITVTDGITVYLRARQDKELYGLLVQDNRERNKAVTLMAERGAMVVEPGVPPKIAMFNGHRQELDRTTGKVTMLSFERYSFDFTWMQRNRGTTWREPNERFLHELLYPDNSSGDKAYRGKLIAEGHNRLTAPFYTFTFIIVALAILLSGSFNKRGQAGRVAVIVVVVVILQGIGIALVQLASKTPTLIPVMYANALVPCLIGLYVLVFGPIKFGRRRTKLMSAPGAAE